MRESYIGCKYFRYNEDGSLDIIRVINDANPQEIKCSVNDNSSKRIKISLEKLTSDYCKLRPDGIIYFNIVNVGELKDVIVMMYREEDIQRKKNMPYIICRQNITDIFANTIKPDYNNLITGLAVSEDSLPEKISMDTILTCDSIEKTTSVAVYMDDTLHDILSMIKTKPYDIILYNLFADHARYKYKDKIKSTMNKDIVDGYSKSLKGLMEDNEFMYEFYRGFGIFPVTFKITEEELTNSKLNLVNTLTMSNILMRKIQETYIIPFDKSFDLDKIERDYFLLIDSNNKLYIVAYTWNGNMDVPVANIESKENIEKMSSIPGYSNNKNILNALKFSTKKYK